MAEPQFETQRSRMIRLYKKSGAKFRANTKPYKSSRAMTLDIVNADVANGIAWAVLRKGQTFDFFAYGLDQPIPDGLGGQRPATGAETNQSNQHATNGAEDFVIEGVSCSAQGFRVQTTGPVTNPPPNDPDVVAALAGTNPMFDPAAIITPPQVYSPFNLQNGIYQAIAPNLSVLFQWDRERTEYIGTLDEVPEGGAKSLLLANGEPTVGNRYKIPEGYLWRRAGQPDSTFVLRLFSEHAVVVPISLIVPVGAAPGAYQAPSKIVLDVTMRLHGLALSPLSAN